MNKTLRLKIIDFLIIPNLVIYAFLAALFFKGGPTYAENLPLLNLKDFEIVKSNIQASAKATLASVTEDKIIDSPKQNNFPWGQCTWYVATKRNVTWNGNAISWYANAKAAGRKVGNKPQKGAIVVLNQGYYGHVGYIESVSSDTFTFSESNNPIPGKVTYKTMDTSERTIIGFIY